MLRSPHRPRPTSRTRRRTGRRIPLWVAILATSLPMFMATLDNLVMTSALPVVQADLGSSVGQLSWFLNAYTLAFATFMLPAATLGDRLGRRRMMLAGVVLFTARLDRLGAQHHERGPDHGPRVPGPRRRGDHAAVADPARGGGADPAAPDGDRHLGRRVRPRGRARSGDRRRRRRGRELAGAGTLDLSARIAALSLQHRIPVVSTAPELTAAGGLVSYGVSRQENYRRSGYFIRKIPGRDQARRPAGRTAHENPAVGQSEKRAGIRSIGAGRNHGPRR